MKQLRKNILSHGVEKNNIWVVMHGYCFATLVHGIRALASSFVRFVFKPRMLVFKARSIADEARKVLFKGQIYKQKNGIGGRGATGTYSQIVTGYHISK